MAADQTPPREILPVAALVALPGTAVLLGLFGYGAIGGRSLLAALVVNAAGAAAIAVALQQAVRRRVAQVLGMEPPGGGGWTAFRRALLPLGQAINTAQDETDATRRELDAVMTILDGVPDPLLWVDGAANVAVANQAANDWLGGSGALVGRGLSTVLRHPKLLAAVSDAQTAGNSHVVEINLPVAAVDRTLEAVVTPLPTLTGGDGAAGGHAAVVLRDLTTVRRGEGMHTDFVANVSHELRTPLAALVGFVETLQGPARGDTEAEERFLALLEQQVGRMQRLVDDLLSLSRIEMKEHSRPDERIDVTRVVRAAVDLLTPTATAMDVEINVNLAPDLPAVFGDEDDLARLFQNLLENAVKYGGAGNDVAVRGESEGERVVVQVCDKGPGIAPDHVPRLTERFYRVDTARSRELGGTGLGLAIVKHIVNRHNGGLTIDSVAGEGSTFSVALPVATDSEDGAENGAEAAGG